MRFTSFIDFSDEIPFYYRLKFQSLSRKRNTMVSVKLLTIQITTARPSLPVSTTNCDIFFVCLRTKIYPWKLSLKFGCWKIWPSV